VAVPQVILFSAVPAIDNLLYGAPDLVTATFVQRPIWSAKFFEIYIALFPSKVKIVPHTLFLPKKLLSMLFTPLSWAVG